MIEIRCCHELRDAEPYRSAINALNLASPQPDPFSTFEFYDYCLRDDVRVPKRGRMRLWLLLAVADGELVGYMALKQSTHRVLGFRARKLDWLTAYVVGRPHLVSRAENAAAVSAAFYQYLLGCGDEWDFLELQQQAADSALLPPPAAGMSRAFRVRSWPNPTHWIIPVRGISIDAYFASLSKKFRSNLSRQMRRLLLAGKVRVLTSTDPQTLTTLFALYRCIAPHSWKAQAAASARDAIRPLDYYQGLVGSAGSLQIVVQVLLLDDVPVAGLICGGFDKGLYALDIVFDDRYCSLAPGQAILLMGVRLAIEGGFEFFDLLRGFGYYKSRWQANMVPTSSLQIYRADSPFLWRRTLGDVLRRWVDPPANPDEIRFNRARREAIGNRIVRTLDLSGQVPGAAVPVPRTRLVADALGGYGEFLSSGQLAAVLPFDTPIGCRDEAPRERAQRVEA